MKFKEDSSNDPRKPAEPERSSGATGPRSSRGKQKSSRNAVRHGVFTHSVPIPGESSNQYRSLLRALREDLTPTGAAEEILVEILAAIFWRQARLFRAEGQEFRRSTEINERFQEAVNVSSSAQIEGSRDGSEHGTSNEPLRTSQTLAILPTPDILATLMSYERHLRREVDHVLDQIDRIRRLRRGCPVRTTCKRVSLDSESRKLPQKERRD
jgi:hypothetical protein